MKKKKLSNGVYFTDADWKTDIAAIGKKAEVIQYGVFFEIIDMRQADTTVGNDYPYVVMASVVVHDDNPENLTASLNYPVRIEHVLIDELRDSASGRDWWALFNLAEAKISQETHNDDTIAIQHGNGTITIHPMLANTAACHKWIDYLAEKLSEFADIASGCLTRPLNTLGHDGWSVLRACLKRKKHRRRSHEQ